MFIHVKIVLYISNLADDSWNETSLCLKMSVKIFWFCKDKIGVFLSVFFTISPFSEFFSVGGMDEFPGLYQRELLGRQVFSWNNELRYRISWNMPLELFIGMSFNLGSTWENTEDPISFSDLLTSWGSYVALNTLIGPIKLAYGHIPDVRDLIYFSIGYEF